MDVGGEMINYNFMNYNKRVYVPGRIVRGEARRAKHYATAKRDISDCAGLFDFVMLHYAYDVTRLRLNKRWKLIGDEMVFDDEAEYYM